MLLKTLANSSCINWNQNTPCSAELLHAVSQGVKLALFFIFKNTSWLEIRANRINTREQCYLVFLLGETSWKFLHHRTSSLERPRTVLVKNAGSVLPTDREKVGRCFGKKVPEFFRTFSHLTRKRGKATITIKLPLWKEQVLLNSIRGRKKKTDNGKLKLLLNRGWCTLA